MNRRGSLLFLAALAAAFLAASCATRTQDAIPREILVNQVAQMAKTGYASLPTISAAGRIRVDTKKARGSADFILLFDPERGVRIDVVDPLYRPLLSAIVKGDQLWLLDHQDGSTGRAEPQDLFEDLTGLSIPDVDFIPLILGKIPPGNVTPLPAKECPNAENTSCYELRDPAGRLHGRVEISQKDGKLLSQTLPIPGSERGILRAEYSATHPAGIPRKVKIHHLRTDDFVIIRYTDIVFGETLDSKMFDPKRFHDDR